MGKTYKAREKESPTYLVIGLEAISKICGTSRNTIAHWGKRHGFPIGKLPNGQWATSRTLIDDWLLYMGQINDELTLHKKKRKAINFELYKLRREANNG